MIKAFPDAYMRKPAGKPGPRKGAKALADKRASTLKTDGNVALYEEHEAYDATFIWYPYLFLGASKPGAHLSALACWIARPSRTARRRSWSPWWKP